MLKLLKRILKKRGRFFMADNPEKWNVVKYVNIIPVEVIKVLDKAISALSTVVNLLTKILKFLAFFISAFNSFSVILQTFILFAQKQIQKLSDDIAGAGVYMNILVPPDFSLNAIKGQSSLAQGGFDGFIQRFRVSLNNTADKNAPHFSDTAQVGGLILLLDTETLYDFFKGLDFLASMFDFMDLIPMNTKPSPPINLRGSFGYFLQPDNTMLPGVKLDWDAPNVRGFTSYRISRSRKSGGITKITHPIPTKLIGPKKHEEEGIIQAALIRLASGAKEWPAVSVQAYDDKTFNPVNISGTNAPKIPLVTQGPVVVAANPVNGGGSYIDYSVDKENNGQYYYVIESGYPIGLWGPRCPELMVPTIPKNCIGVNQAAVVEHPGGIESIGIGSPSLGQWSSIQTKSILPFLPKILDFINKFVASLAGALKTNTKALNDFLTGIQKSFEKQKNYLDVLIGMIVAIENFFSGLPVVGFLNINPQKGGTANFINRVINAQKPAKGFSGPSGYTMGIVFVYGEVVNLEDMSDADKAQYKALIKAIGKSFEIIMKILS